MKDHDPENFKVTARFPKVACPALLVGLVLIMGTGFTGEQAEQGTDSASIRALRQPPSLAPGEPDPAAKDPDGDGVPTAVDSCPTIPNPPVNGAQPNVCGPALRALVDRRVFLKSRTFAPTVGLDPALQDATRAGRVHVLLHVAKNDNGVVLTRAQKQRLNALGVRLLGYVPYRSYYASVPGKRPALAAILGLETVTGMTALTPSDRLAPAVRLRGARTHNPDGTSTFDVDFFADVPIKAAENSLAQTVDAFEHQYDQTYRVTITSQAQLARLSMQDTVQWIDDLPTEIKDYTLNAQGAIGALPVSQEFGYRGAGIVVSAAESGHIEPLSHPSFGGRLWHGNAPVGGPNGTPDHARAVGAILAADIFGFPVTHPEQIGFLPEARIVGYRVGQGAVMTTKRRYYGVAKDAREFHGALLMNISWGDPDCSKIGEYNDRAKWRDKAVTDSGIVIVTAVGNNRGPDAPGMYYADCGFPDFYSLGDAAAKNDIAVGNWCFVAGYDADSCPTAGILSNSSSAGPTADFRLKPDVVAPGDGIATIGYNDSDNTTFNDTFGGTSAAAPVVSGIVGWIGEAFVDQGWAVDEIPPERIKAILIHTAKDVGLAGPDFKTGYGLVQPAPALRIAEEWDEWGREGILSETVTELEFEFDVNTPIFTYRATLAYSDEQGERTPTLALKNDLDLTLVNPSGAEIYYSYNLSYPAGAVIPAEPCESWACYDRFNNVEQVVVSMPDGSEMERGRWKAVVRVANLVSDEQSFSLVLSPPCPIVITENTTLGDLSCAPHRLQPAAVELVAQDTTLDCNDHEISDTSNAADSIGVHVLANRVTVQNCIVSDFDRGIVVGDQDIFVQSATLDGNSCDYNERRCIEAWGDFHNVLDNGIGYMRDRFGIGLAVRGDGVRLSENVFSTVYTGPGDPQNIALHVDAGRADGDLDDNTFSGEWVEGIRIESDDADKPTTDFSVRRNTFEGIGGTPIIVSGNVVNAQIEDNDLLIYGIINPGIRLEARGDLQPFSSLVSLNQIVGAESTVQTGIELAGTNTTTVAENDIQGVGIGIMEDGTAETEIDTNDIINPPTSTFLTKVGIDSRGSSGKLVGGQVNSHIKGNTIERADVGVAVSGEGDQLVAGNTLRALGTAGITVSDAGDDTFVAGNDISSQRPGPPPVTGIHVSASEEAAVNDNNLRLRGGVGIVLERSNFAEVLRNEVATAGVAIRILDTTSASVRENEVDDAAAVGIQVSGDDSAQLFENEIINNSAIGIHYADGERGLLNTNTVDSAANGIGVRLGTDSSGTCTDVVVDDVTLEYNILTGGTDLEVLCDVGYYKVVP